LVLSTRQGGANLEKFEFQADAIENFGAAILLPPLKLVKRERGGHVVVVCTAHVHLLQKFAREWEAGA
jgi:hypothetical protein